MSEPKKQHYISKTYLKHFTEGKSPFVYVFDFSNPHRSEAQKRGVNSPIFKIKDYYSSHDGILTEPYILEKTFSFLFESHYNDIINEISKEKNLSLEIREKLMIWLFGTQLKSPLIRNSFFHVTNWLYKVSSSYRRDGFYKNHKEPIEKYIKHISKINHLTSFADEQISKLFIEGLSAKKWTILKPPVGHKFWTNDNPGFSPNLDLLFQKERRFHHQFELNAHSICYFVLTPGYCIQFSPFLKSDPPSINGLNMEITYVEINSSLYDEIMRGVFETRYKLIIADNKEIFKKVKSQK